MSCIISVPHIVTCTISMTCRVRDVHHVCDLCHPYVIYHLHVMHCDMYHVDDMQHLYVIHHACHMQHLYVIDIRMPCIVTYIIYTSHIPRYQPHVHLMSTS